MNNIFIKNGNILTESGFVKGNLLIENGKIKAIKSINEKNTNQDIYEINADGNMIIPGFIDIHTHGADGVDINHAVKDDYKKLNNFFASKGVTSYLPTIAGDTHENTKKALHEINKAMENGVIGSEILGVHLEGPYLCKAYKGAIPEEVFRSPNINELNEYQDITKNKIKHITLAPENDGTVEFIREVKEKMPFVTISAGHTGASYERTMDCIHNGLDHATHTFNAMKMIHHREPGVMGAVFDSNITAEIIPDGKHCHPSMVRLLLKIKGLEKMIIVTDSAAPTGLPDGEYILGGNDIILENGDLWVKGGRITRAGSVLTMIEAYENLIDFTKISKAQASLLVSRNPARLLGYNYNKGQIKTGFDGDVVIINNNYDIFKTIVKGKVVYSK